MDSANATYTIAPAFIGSDDGEYTCVAKIDTVASDASAPIVVTCKYGGPSGLMCGRCL